MHKLLKEVNNLGWDDKEARKKIAHKGYILVIITVVNKSGKNRECSCNRAKKNRIKS